MAIGARLKVEGVKEAVQRLDDVGYRARHPEPALRSEATKADLGAGEARLFARSPWPPDSSQWASYKRRHGLDPRVLRATGRLEGALTSGTGMTFRAWNATLWWGIPLGRSDLYYAQPLAKGAGHRKPRRMVVIDQDTRVRIGRRVQIYITDGFV